MVLGMIGEAFVISRLSTWHFGCAFSTGHRKTPVHITVGTSLATMIPRAVVGGGIKLAQGFVDVGAGLVLTVGTIIGRRQAQPPSSASSLPP